MLFRSIILSFLFLTSNIIFGQQPKLILPIGHNGAILSAQFSPDCKRVVTASDDYKAIIWDVASGALLATLSGHNHKVYTANYNPTGNKIVTASHDGLAKIWNAETGALLFNLEGHSDPVNTARFSPDGKKIVTASNDGLAMVWDVSRGKLLMTLIDSKKYYITDASFSPDGKIIVTASADGLAKIWNGESGNLKFVLQGHKDHIFSARFSPDGKKIVTASFDASAKIWDVSSGNLIANLIGHKGAVYSAEFNKGNNIIVTASEDNTAILWDAISGIKLKTLIGHNRIINLAKFSPDGKKVVTASRDGTAKVWDVDSGELLEDINGHEGNVYVQFADFSSDSKKIITSSEDKTAKIWNSISGKLQSDLKGHTEAAESAQFNENGEIIETTNWNNTAIDFWNVNTGTFIKTWWGKSYFTPYDKKDLTILFDTVVIKDAVSKQILGKLFGHTDAIFSAQFSPDGKKIVTASFDNTIKLWDTESQKLIYTFFKIDSIDYFSQIPSGYYQTTTSAAKLLHYVTKDLKVITFEQLDVKYNRPDKVLEAIGNTDTALINSYRKAYEKRIKKLGIDTTAFRDGYSVPEADFTNRDNIEYEQKNGTLQLHIKGIDSTYKLDRFNVWINEAPLYGQRGISIKKKNTNSFDTTVTIRLSQGENRIETSIINVNGTESYRMPLMVNYTPEVKQKEMIRFIGIGIDKFSESKYDLQYSTKDIRDLAKSLKERYKEEIIIDTLFNENVTTSSVKALKQKLLQTSVNDKVIISYSGHGMLSKDYDYFLSTYSVNFSKPEENGLPYDELENLLDSIPARKKLMLIDACHSGEVDKEEGIAMQKMADSLGLNKGIDLGDNNLQTQHVGLKNSFELMQSLFVNVSKSTGATIISAAAGNQFALERGDLKNGVFTYSLLEAMEKNQTLKISELKKIVGERVEQLTNGLQKPTSRNETIAVDWEL